MARSLPSAIEGVKDGDTEVVILFDISVAPVGTYYWATRTITVTDYEQPGLNPDFQGGRILADSIGDLMQSVNLEDGGNVATRGSFSFKVANPEWTGSSRADQIFESGLGLFTFINREVKVYIAMTSAGTVSFSDIQLLYIGSILETRWDYGAYEFILQNKELDRHVEIPNMEISHTNFPLAPDRNLGKPIPLIYGDNIAETQITRRSSVQQHLWDLFDLAPVENHLTRHKPICYH